MRLFLFSILVTFNINSALANEPRVCSDLATTACSPGGRDDGTGRRFSANEIRSRQLQFSLQMDSFIEEKAQESLNGEGPNGDNFLNSVIKAFNLENTEQSPCYQNRDSSCMEAAREGLGSMLRNNGQTMSAVRSGQPNNVGPVSLLNLDVVVNMAEFQDLNEAITERSAELALPEGVETSIETQIFPEAKRLILERIASLNIDESLRESITARVNAIDFDGTTCSGDDGTRAGLDQVYIDNAFYQPATNTIQYCSGSLQSSTSHFSIFTGIAHEIAHSIDPCNIEMGTSFNYPRGNVTSEELDGSFYLPEVISCLRSPESLEARNVSEELRGAPPDAQFNNEEMMYHCEDQITESFCDWFAAEVISDYITTNFPKLTPDQVASGYINANATICDFMDSNNRVHPNSRSRINRLFLVNPEIREHIGCQQPPANGAIYCSSEGPANRGQERPQSIPEYEERYEEEYEEGAIE